MGARPIDAGVAGVLLEQDGVLRTADAVRAFGRPHVRHNLAMTRWQRPARGVVVAHNGPLSDGQRDWVALLACPDGSALASRTALRYDGYSGPAPAWPSVVLPEGANRPTYADLAPHWSKMLESQDVHPFKKPRRTRPARSLVDEASGTGHERGSREVILSGAQQGLAATRQFRDALSRRGPCRHRGLIVESILDAAGGVQSLPERDFEQIWRNRGLPPPRNQSIRRRADGKYYLDAEWVELGAAVEVHGIPHMRVGQWDADLFRANEITIAGPRLLIFSSYAVRRQQQIVGEQLLALLRRGGWSG